MELKQELKKISRSQLVAIYRQSGSPFGTKTSTLSKAQLLERLEAHPDQSKVQSAYDAVIKGKAEVSKDDIKQAIQEALDAGDFDSAMQRIQEAKLDELIEARLGDINVEASSPREIIIKDKQTRKIEGVLPKEFERIVQLATQRVNTMMVGPAGCGKSFIAEKVAEALGLSFSSISCTAGMSESQVLGWLLPTGKGGQFEYRAAPFIDAYEKGGVFLFDEIDSADPNMLTVINQALANGGFMVPQRLDNPYVKRHPDFVCLAAANTFGNGADMQYVGRNQLDAATLDRFRVGIVQMDYSPAVEASIVDKDILHWGRKIREAIKKHQLLRIMSTRVMRDFTMMKDAYNWTIKEIEETYFQDWSADEVRRVKAEV